MFFLGRGVQNPPNRNNQLQSSKLNDSEIINALNGSGRGYESLVVGRRSGFANPCIRCRGRQVGVGLPDLRPRPAVFQKAARTVFSQVQSFLTIAGSRQRSNRYKIRLSPGGIVNMPVDDPTKRNLAPCRRRGFDLVSKIEPLCGNLNHIALVAYETRNSSVTDIVMRGHRRN